MKAGKPLPWFLKRASALAAALFLAGPASASQSNTGLGSQTAAFLTVAPDARSAAMGQAGAALSNGADSLGLNPAGLASQEGQDLELSQSILPQGSTLSTVEYGMGLGHSALGLSAGYTNMGSVERTTFSGGNLVDDGTFTPYGYNIGLAYAASLMDRLSLGGIAKLAGQDIDGNGAMTGAADLGLQYRLPQGFSLGAALQNLGGTLYGAQLPLQGRAGLSFDNISPAGGLSLSVDAVLPTAATSQTSVAAGMELQMARYLSLRAGYQTADQSGLDGMTGLSAGAGFGDQGWRVDYAWVPQGDLGTSNQFSFSTTF
jgi:hypothetical protein